MVLNCFHYHVVLTRHVSMLTRMGPTCQPSLPSPPLLSLPPCLSCTAATLSPRRHRPSLAPLRPNLTSGRRADGDVQSAEGLRLVLAPPPFALVPPRPCPPLPCPPPAGAACLHTAAARRQTSSVPLARGGAGRWSTRGGARLGALDLGRAGPRSSAPPRR